MRNFMLQSAGSNRLQPALDPPTAADLLSTLSTLWIEASAFCSHKSSHDFSI